MNSKPRSTILIRHSEFTALGVALLAAIALFTAAPGVVAQNVTINAADFQRMVYSAHLHTQLALKPELGASLQVLLEMQRRNPNANPAALAGLCSNALQLYRSNAPCYIRTNGYPDEILAAYLDAVRQVPAHTNCFGADLTLLNCFMLSQADYDDFTNDTVLDLINSADQRLSSSEGQAIKRQALVDNCVARAQANSAFASAMESLLWPETQVSLADTPAEIIGNTNSPLHDDLAMQTLLALSAASSDGSLTVSSNQLMNLFVSEMQTMRNTINTNLAVLAQINEGQPDYLAYLTNQAVLDANVQFQAAMQQGQPAQLASATAAVLSQSEFMPVSTDTSAEAEQAVDGLGSMAIGIGGLCLGDPCGMESILSGGLSLFNLFGGGQSQQDVMANQISNIQTMMGDLSTNMNYRFDRMDQSLTTIYTTLNSNFSQIEITLGAQGQQIAELQGSVDDIRSGLVDVEAGLDRIESENFADFSALQNYNIIQDINGDLLYEVQFPSRPPISETTYEEVENTFYGYATSLAQNSISSPSTFAAEDFKGSAVQTQLAAYPLDANLNYIQQFLSTLGQSTGGTPPPLANPQEWFIAAYAYLQLAGENPMWFRDSVTQRRVSDIIGRGENLTNFCGSLTFSGPNINWPLYYALEGYYATNLVSFYNQVSNAEYNYSLTNSFALGAWRQWDLAAPHVTATATALRFAPPIPLFVVPREPAICVAAGAYHSLALKADGTVVAWGAGLMNNPSDSVDYGQSIIPASLNNVVAIAAGGYHSLALRANGTAVSWGDNEDGQTNIPAGLGNVAAIAAGASYCMALQSNGAVVAWGDNTYGQTNIPSGLSNVVAIAAGANHSLALNADGTVVGWGYNYYGQATGAPMPVPPFASAGVVMVGGQALSNVVAIAAGECFSLALLRDGTVVGWGENTYGEATGAPSLQIPPIGSGFVELAGQTLSNVVRIAAGAEHSLALRADGTVAAWGDNTCGQTNISVGLNGARAIAAGAYHSLALNADGTVVAWGRINERQCLTPPALTWSGAISTGIDHTMALNADGTVVGWGGLGYTGDTGIPASWTNAVAIAAGGSYLAGHSYSLALQANGKVVGWGDNFYGQTNIPVGLTNVLAIAAGDYSCLALKANGTVVGWGDNTYGQTNIPTGLGNVVAIAQGGYFDDAADHYYYHCLALKVDGTVAAWGDNSLGQSSIPAGLSNVAAIAAGMDFDLALKSDGTVVGWGDNSSGQTNIPTGLSNVVAIAAGTDFNLALKSDGTVVGWGDNSWGEVSAVPDTNYPWSASGAVTLNGQPLTNVVAIAADSDHSLALQADGTIVAWGANIDGETTVPLAWNNVVAISGGQGSDHGLALTSDGAMVGWGATYDGQGAAAGLTNVTALAVGPQYSLALMSNSTVVIWGNVNEHILPPAGLSNVVASAVGNEQALALKADGTVVVWGGNTWNQASLAPGLNNVVAIATGFGHCLALRADGTVLGWGFDASGQATGVPNSNPPNSSAGAVMVGGHLLSGVVAIAAGQIHSLALRADGTVVGWGYNSYGEATGVPTTTGDFDNSGPVVIGGRVLSNVVAIAAGWYHSLALKADGTVVGWGDNSAGETTIPAGLSNVVAIAANGYQSVFLTATNASGFADGGNMSFVDAEIPERVATLFCDCNDSTINQMSLGGPMYASAGALTGAKTLMAAVLELGMPYTLAHDGILRGCLYGKQSLMDTSAATNFLQTQNAQLQATPSAPPQALAVEAPLAYECFVNRLNQCLTKLQATGQPEIPRLVGHTLRLLNLLSDAWTPPANSPPPVLEISSASNAPSLLLYGEPYMNYTLQYCDALGVPGWTTTITNLQDEQTTTPPFPGSPHRFYRAALRMP